VPKKEALKKKILDEAQTLRYSIHPGSTKMYHNLRQQFWWTRMKREAAHYVSECDTCRKVRADYMKPEGLLQPLSISEWKWDDIVTEPPRGGVRHQDQLERFLVKREYNQNT
jgi:hypothetical protein